jgi:hypothetical protein
MVNVIISESRHCVVAVVIVRLEPDIHSLLLSDFLCCGDEILRKKLLLLVEVVTSALG